MAASVLVRHNGHMTDYAGGFAAHGDAARFSRMIVLSASLCYLNDNGYFGGSEKSAARHQPGRRQRADSRVPGARSRGVGRRRADPVWPQIAAPDKQPLWQQVSRANGQPAVCELHAAYASAVHPRAICAAQSYWHTAHD